MSAKKSANKHLPLQQWKNNMQLCFQEIKNRLPRLRENKDMYYYHTCKVGGYTDPYLERTPCEKRIIGYTYEINNVVRFQEGRGGLVSNWIKTLILEKSLEKNIEFIREWYTGDAKTPIGQIKDN